MRKPDMTKRISFTVDNVTYANAGLRRCRAAPDKNGGGYGATFFARA